MSYEKSLEYFGQLMHASLAGSISYGTDIETSDKDVRGIFIPHRKFLVGMNKVDMFKDPKDEDTVYFSLDKFLNLALEGNPNVVEQLFVKEDHVVFCNEFGKELREMRDEFLTKNAYGRFGSYAFSQMKRLNNKNNGSHHGSHKELIDTYGYDTKHAMHLVRLFQMGIQILKYRQLDTFRPNREELLAIRHGSLTLDQILKYAEELNAELEDAMKHSTIPDYPDFDKVNKWAVNVVDRAHGLKTTKGVFKGAQFNVLPLEYEMVDKCALYVVSNRLVRRKSKSQAKGVIVPYKDWFTGLRIWEKPFKFEETTIDTLHRTIGRARQCDPTIIDMLFVSEKHILYKHPMAEEMLDKIKTLFTTKFTYNKAYNYINGNLKEMRNWERLKREWNLLKEKEPEKHNTEFPPVPKKTEPDEASMMTKYGYNTILAYDLVHVARMFIELLSTGTIQDSRAFDSELYAIKHGTFKTFEEYEKHILNLLEELEQAKENSVLGSHNFDEIEEWLIDFVERFHSQLD